MRICSACLLGIKCRYNRKSKPHLKILELSRREVLIPVCPEQLGGLATPRERSEKNGRRVVTESGKDVTDDFKKGAREVLKIAKLFKVKTAILKQRSAACGCGRIYDGTFRSRVIKGNGVLASLLKKNGIAVISEEEL